ncbi:small basic protein [San Miguel sea lion virus 12]|nr:small basic protein [San Miguel sea lion virus 12]
MSILGAFEVGTNLLGAIGGIVNESKRNEILANQVAIQKQALEYQNSYNWAVLKFNSELAGAQLKNQVRQQDLAYHAAVHGPAERLKSLMDAGFRISSSNGLQLTFAEVDVAQRLATTSLYSHQPVQVGSSMAFIPSGSKPRYLSGTSGAPGTSRSVWVAGANTGSSTA